MNKILDLGIQGEQQAGERLSRYSAKASEEDIKTIGRKIGKMNKQAVRQVWNDVQTLFEMVKDPSAAWASKAVAVGALLYLVCPMDAVPDMLPVIGLSDDAGVILAAIATLSQSLAVYRKKRANDAAKECPSDD